MVDSSLVLLRGRVVEVQLSDFPPSAMSPCPTPVLSCLAPGENKRMTLGISNRTRVGRTGPWPYRGITVTSVAATTSLAEIVPTVRTLSPAQTSAKEGEFTPCSVKVVFVGATSTV